ncbi:uncharacterized protein RSE6_01169 [Rhynchosporium secalis]|uniref:Uncharacterized protein n=1 Tax=Rhynchosporium secalis TaxID=38038 RepID=A0A1E1LX61_RHYSE|nr:uncharacterized protein RSE6_01169 [Rhynchosporium secalis]
MREGADQARQTSVTSIDLCELSTEATCMIVVQRRKKITKLNQRTFESHIDSVVVVPVILILTSIHIASACRAKRKYGWLEETAEVLFLELDARRPVPIQNPVPENYETTLDRNNRRLMPLTACACLPKNGDGRNDCCVLLET